MRPVSQRIQHSYPNTIVGTVTGFGAPVLVAFIDWSLVSLIALVDDRKVVEAVCPPVDRSIRASPNQPAS
jgi:hypothetical protein